MTIRLELRGETKEFDILEKDGIQYLFPKEDLLQVPEFLFPTENKGFEYSELPDGTMIFNIKQDEEDLSGKERKE